jgi:trans-2-enoyl-CoA reductase
MVNPENVHATRAQHVARMVRDRIIAEARKEVRSRIESAGGRWSDWAGIVAEALAGFLETDAPRHVILYHASQRTHPIYWRGRASDAMNTATRRAVRAIGPLMAYQAMIRVLDSVCATLGESDPLVQRLRENDRESRRD